MPASASEPVWLTSDDLVRLNQLIVAGTGEPFAILKRHELESAPTRPRHLWLYEQEENLAVLAVRLMLAVARAHAFAQGNKRTGFIAAAIFLEANGWILDLGDQEVVGELIEEAVRDDSIEPILIELFEDMMIEAC